MIESEDSWRNGGTPGGKTVRLSILAEPTAVGERGSVVLPDRPLFQGRSSRPFEVWRWLRVGRCHASLEQLPCAGCRPRARIPVRAPASAPEPAAHPPWLVAAYHAAQEEGQLGTPPRLRPR